MAGANFDGETWRELRLRAIFDHCKWDSQCGDQAVLARFPLTVAEAAVRQIAGIAEALTEEALVGEQEILGQPQLLKRLGLPRAIQDCLSRAGDEGAAGSVRVMRFDFHYTTEGWRISEVNADVPGGYVEASGCNALFTIEPRGGSPAPDPTREYAKAICADLPSGSLIALTHTTVYSEDRQLMVYLGRELERRGMRACLASPRNISWQRGWASLRTNFANEVPAFVVRLSPAEWLPAESAREHWTGWFQARKTPVSNPGRAIVLQSKRFPLAWEAMASGLATWRRLLPETRCPSRTPDMANGEWVLKPAFGRVGEDVGIRGVSASAEYDRICTAARKRPEQWVAQKRFQVMPVTTEEGDVFPCIGVYTVNGKFAGLYGRASRTPLVSENAFDVAVLIRNDQARSAQ